MAFYQGETHRERILAALMEERAHPPTQRDLADELGMSFGNMRYHLEHLRTLGYVSWLPNAARTLAITDAGRDATRGLRSLNGKETRPDAGITDR